MSSAYPTYTRYDSNRGWHGEWFYIRNLVEASFPSFTGVTSAGSPTVKALREKSHRKKSACGSIPRKASQTVTKPAMCSTPVELRCCSSRP